MQEVIDGNWSTITLERQVNSLYFERMVMTQKNEGKQLVKAEAETKKEVMQAKDIIKDPYVLDFLILKTNEVHSFLFGLYQMFIKFHPAYKTWGVVVLRLHIH